MRITRRQRIGRVISVVWSSIAWVIRCVLISVVVRGWGAVRSVWPVSQCGWAVRLRLVWGVLAIRIRASELGTLPRAPLMRVVLGSSQIVVLIDFCLRWLICLLAFVLWCHLRLSRLNTNWLKSRVTVNLLWLVSFHLQDEVAVLDVGLRGAEGRVVGIKGRIVALVPPVSVESLELIAPMEIEAFSLLVVRVGFNVVVHHVPRHIASVKSFAPRLESWGPKVHHYAHRLACEVD